MIPFENWHIGANLGPLPPTRKERHAGRGWFSIIIMLLLAYVFICLTGCRTGRTVDERVNAGIVPREIGLPAQSTDNQLSGQAFTDNQCFTQLPDPKPSIINQATDAVGLSTPAGRARRQAVRLARATAPHVGKGGVLAINSNVSSGYKARAPVTTAGTGATVSNAAENSQQQAVKGNGNELSAKQANPTQEAPGPLAVIADNLTGPLGAVLALAAAGLIVVILLRRKAAKNIV